MVREYFAYDSTCKVGLCIFQKVQPLNGKSRFKCASCFKIKVLGEQEKEKKRVFKIKEKAETTNNKIKLKF